MNLSKQKAFNEKMGKAKHFPRHQNLSKGGMVDRRKHFDDGGVATTQASGTGGSVGGPTQTGGLFGALTQQSGYNAQLAPTTQLNYTPTIGAASTGALNAEPVNNAIGAEQTLASQYGDIAAGRGPNPALTALNQQTGQNVATQGALQAGQRGGSQNVGLLARQIGQQGASTQQAATANAANLQANQSLNALGAEGTLQNQIANQGLGEQGTQANVYGTSLGGLNTQNSTNVGNYAQAQGTNAATAQANATAAAKTGGGLLGGVGSVLSSIFDKGGEVEKLDNGTPATVQPEQSPTSNISVLNPNNAQVASGNFGSYLGKALSGAGDKNSKQEDSDPTGFKSLGSGLGSAFNSATSASALNPLSTSAVGDTAGTLGEAGGLAGGAGEAAESLGVPASLAPLAEFAVVFKGGEISKGPHQSHIANYLFAGGATSDKVPALVSAKEVYLNPHQVKEVVERGADPMRIGHHFPGQDKVKKNSPKNDVIPTELEDGGVVVPISITTHKEASEKSRKFVEKAHAKRYLKKPKGI